MISFVAEIKSGDYLPNPYFSSTPAICTHRVSSLGFCPSSRPEPGEGLAHW